VKTKTEPRAESAVRKTVLELSNVALGYGGDLILTGISLRVGAGERIAVLGPNGAGKTTLLRGLVGLLPPLTGEVMGSSSRFGLVPQRERLDPIFPITTRELVLQGAIRRLGGWRRSFSRVDRARAERFLEELHLGPHADRPLNHLSGGQRQRALVARALMSNPEVLLLDEPTSGVDQQSTEVILGQVDRAAREEGIASLLVTHDERGLQERVDRIWRVDARGVRVTAGGAMAPHDPMGSA